MTTYKEAGVDVGKNEMLVSMIKGMTDISTGFADIQDIGNNQYIALSCDGVGTKIKLLSKYPQLAKTVGQDLVGMCANDLICSGADPTFFMDYIGMNSLDERIIKDVIAGIQVACDLFGMKLVGGEMAEMPNTYVGAYPELVGFAVGFGRADTMINKDACLRGDVVIGLESSGPHSNGYSLINAIGIENFSTSEILQFLLEPTRLYTDLNSLYQALPNMFLSMAHITGGGLVENTRRAIPEGLDVEFNYTAWEVPSIFRSIQKLGEVEEESMWTTFNMGIGMVAIVAPDRAEFLMNDLFLYNPKIIGRLV